MCASAKLGLAGLSIALCLAAPARSDPADLAPRDDLGAREIYLRVLENRFDSALQEMTLVSERGGRGEPLRIQVMWRRYDGESREASRGILSRTVVRYLAPGDLRDTAYLVVDRLRGPDDQFVHLPSYRRTRRVHVPGLTIAGTDFSVEDFVPGDIDYARYTRAPDRFVGKTRCYVVEAIPHPETKSIHSRVLLYVEPDRFVPLRIRYWDEGGVEVKELRAPADSIRELDGRFHATRSIMSHHQADSHTRAHLEVLVANPSLPSRYFSMAQLEAPRLRIPRPLVGQVRRY